MHASCLFGFFVISTVNVLVFVNINKIINMTCFVSFEGGGGVTGWVDGWMDG